MAEQGWDKSQHCLCSWLFPEQRTSVSRAVKLPILAAVKKEKAKWVIECNHRGMER